MVAQHDPNDEPFFREWNANRNLMRSRDRSAQLQEALGLERTLPVPAVLVVGSKGKGTAVAAATSALVKRGVVGTVTSPPLRHNRERIRVNGRAISHDEYARVSAMADRAVRSLPEVSDGYLPPSGVFTQVGIAYLLERGVDYLVVEEGLGGVSDDVSLFDYPVVGVTQIFLEHADVLGGSLDAIAQDLLGVVTPATRTVVSYYDQPELVWDVLEARQGECGCRVELAQASTITATNLEVGARAAAALTGAYVPVSEGELILPARASVHGVPGSDATWMVDAAISPEGVAHAVERATEELESFHVLAGFPDVKDVDGCVEALADLPVTFVGAGREYLEYSRAGEYAEVVSPEDAFAQAVRSGKNFLVVGTMSFAGVALDFLDAPTDFWW